jgi:hypothetical protein
MIFNRMDKFSKDVLGETPKPLSGRFPDGGFAKFMMEWRT